MVPGTRWRVHARPATRLQPLPGVALPVGAIPGLELLMLTGARASQGGHGQADPLPLQR